MRIADRAGNPLDAVRHHLWMVDVIGSRVDHSRNDDHICRETLSLKASVLVLVPRIRHREQQSADARLEQKRKNLIQWHVASMRPFVIAPAYVQPDLLGRNVL